MLLHSKKHSDSTNDCDTSDVLTPARIMYVMYGEDELTEVLSASVIYTEVSTLVSRAHSPE